MKTNGFFVYITCETQDEAKKIARHLFEKKLIACANMFPVTSMYRWEGKIVDEPEFVLLVKTLDALYDDINKEVSGIHSYSIPCITKIPVEFNEKFGQWLLKEVER